MAREQRLALAQVTLRLHAIGSAAWIKTRAR
jgi:hypothetical protein